MQGMDVASIRDVARRFRSQSQQLEGIQQQISRLVSLPYWRGPDNDQFKAQWDGQVRRTVLDCSQALEDAASALERNADAQERTSNTLDGGASGGGVTGGGSTGSGTTGGGSGTGGGDGAPDEEDDKTFHFTGKDDDAIAKGPGEMGMISGVDGHKDWGSNAVIGPDGKPVGPPDQGVQTHFNFAHGSIGDKGTQLVDGKGEFAGMSWQGDVTKKAGMFGDGTFYATKGGFGVEGSIALGVEYSGKGSVDFGGGVSGTAEGSVFAGGKAEGSLDVGYDHANLNASAFAGVKAEGNVGIDVGGAKAGVTGEAWAGVGGEINANVGYKDGHLTIGGSAGFALGVGGKIGIKIDVDVPKTVDKLKDAAAGVAHFFGL